MIINKVKTQIKLAILIIGISLSACKQESNTNDVFRTEILSKVSMNKDTLQIFNDVLDKLDKKYISFGEFIKKQFYGLEDSCKIVHKKKLDSLYENNLYQERSDFMYPILVEAHRRYLSSLDIKNEELDAIQYYMNSNDYTIKKYLNKKYNLAMYIPEE